MNRIVRVLFTLTLLLITLPRLPAPISEVPQTTPTPKPKREAISKPKQKAETTPKPKVSPTRSFAGAWAGITINKGSDGSSGSSNYIIRISDDEKTVWINWNETGEPISGPGRQIPCNRFRETLTWSLTFPEVMVTDTLRIDGNGNASFVREGSFISGDYQGTTYNQTGTFSRQDVSSTVSTPQTTTTPAPQTTTAAAPKNVGGLPVAKPVPNKPGFVYNPFDPNSPILLDVRGKTSGGKVKDPFSGKLFIVP
jgi:hypothetical protein